MAPCFWPYDLLQHDFDNIRVFTFGYDSRPSTWYGSSANQMNIDQHSKTMLQKIGFHRMSCPGRPIIFVAHSLGGILVKNLLIESAKHKWENHHLRDVGESCCAVFFFGTPHRGSDAAGLGKVVANIIQVIPGAPSVYKGLLKDLGLHSDKLTSIIGDFNDIVGENKIKIYSFQEGKGYARFGIFDRKVRRRLSVVTNPCLPSGGS